MKPYKKLKSTVLFDRGIFTIKTHQLENQRNQHSFEATILEAADAANVIALTPKREIIFVKQYRFGIEDYTLELPGGMLDPGENPLEACQRELKEETAYATEDWEYLGKIGSNPVFMNNYIHHFLAKDVLKSNVGQNLDLAEQIDLVFIPEQEVKAMIRQGAIIHPHSLTALYAYFFNEF